MKLNKWREGELEGRGVGRKRWDKSPHLCPYVTALCTSTGKRKIPCNCFIHLNYLSLWLANGEKKGKRTDKKKKRVLSIRGYVNCAQVQNIWFAADGKKRNLDPHPE